MSNPIASNGLTAQEWAVRCKAITYAKCSKCNGSGVYMNHMPGWPPWKANCYVCSGTGYALKREMP